MSDTRKVYHLWVNVSDDAITINEIAPLDEMAHHIVADEFEVVVYSGALVDTFVAIEIGRFIERKEQGEDQA